MKEEDSGIANDSPNKEDEARRRTKYRPRCESFLNDQEVVLALEDTKPGFVDSLKAFSHFLSLALDDLTLKKEMASSKTDIESAPVRNYIRCQCFMLQKHIHRLERFDREVTERLNKMDAIEFERPLSPVITSDDEVDGGKAMFDSFSSDSSGPVRDRSVSSASSQDSCQTNISEASHISADDICKPRKELSQLEADMIKMKRRCKHMLDVADRYIGPLETCVSMSESEVSSGSPVNSHSIEDKNSPSEKFEDFKAFRLTCESFGDHLKVLIKTYTNKHSSRLNSV